MEPPMSNPSTLSPLAAARHAKVLELARMYTEMGEKLTADLNNPTNKTEEALTGEEWDIFSQLIARFAIILNRTTVSVITTEAPQ